MEPRVALALTFVSELRREVSLTEMARSMHMSASSLRHLFTIEMDISLLRDLKEQRMRRAKELLEITHFNLKQIMARVGIKDRSHSVRDSRAAYWLSAQRY
jgi:AraC-like DNA-binding protein